MCNRFEKRVKPRVALKGYTICIMHVFQVKGIVQPQKRGSRGAAIGSTRLRRKSPMFFQVHLMGYSRAFNLEKNGLQRLGPKKVESFFMWSGLPKPQNAF